MTEEKTEKEQEPEKSPEEKKYALYLGCVIPTQMPHIEKLGKVVLPKLGFSLVDAEFTCCPYYAVKDIDEKKWLVAAARNLAVAEEKGFDIISLCNGCSQTLIEAKHMLDEDRDLRIEINKELAVIGKEYKGKVSVRHFMMVLDEYREKIKELTVRPFSGYLFATHTGCHLLRPSQILGFDNPEDPKKFDEFVEALGANALDYQHKALCCGSAQLTREKDMALSMMKDKLEELKEKKADALAVCCPSCFLQFDKNSVLLKAKYKEDMKIPVMHALQMLGLALGMSTAEVFAEKNRSMNPEFLKRLESL
ncbi:MAG: CoB--CoM heterodisulfide reductase iron-sulfur subunit B family protein [Nanoarchaeota archaeon]|nr:CoB--CoM heterodisulfide reductase iron-sulfur subunit B family protein [Nanoarchaeota archaeon]